MTFRQLITLEGGEAIKAALHDIGEAGVAAFKQFQDAIAKVDTKKMEDNLKKISDQAGNVKDSFGTLGTDLEKVGKDFAIIGATISTAAIGFVAWIKSGAEAEISIQNLSRQAGTSAGEMQAMIGAMSESGVGADNLEVAFKRLAVRVATDWPQIKKSIRDAADSAIKDQLAIEDAVRGLERAQIALAQFNRDPSKQPTGTVAAPSTGFELQQERDRVALLDKADALAKVQSAQLKISEAEKKAADDAAASAPVLKKYVEDLAAGFDNAASDITKSVANIFKGIVASVGAEGKGLADLVGTPELQKVVFLLADVMKNMRSETDKTALAVLAFGRGVGENLVQFLSKGRDGIRPLMDDLTKLGLVKFDPNIARGFDESIASLGVHVDLIFRQIKDLFMPGLTIAFKSLDDLVISNKDRLLELASTIATNVLSVLRDLILLMSGKSELVQNQWIIDWKNGIINLKDDIVGFKDTAKSAFNELMSVLNSIAAKITSITGKKITGEDLGIALLVGQFTGLNTVILDVIKTIGVLLAAAVVIAVSLPASVAAAVPAMVAAVGSFIGAMAILLAGDYLQAPFNKFMNWLVDTFFPSLGPAIVGAWNSAIQSFLDAIDNAINSIKQKWEALKQLLATSLTLGTVTGGAQSLTELPAGAAGGFIRGAGTSTSDSILAWLSDQEFVVNARAVKHYGSDFFAALNSMRLPRDILGGFNMGGLVDAMARSSMPLPRFAGGGMAAAGGRSLTLVLDTNRFTVSGQKSVIDALESEVARRGLASTGWSPGWVGR
jgi:hypothetical protein